MLQQVLDAHEARKRMRDVLDAAGAGRLTVIERFGKPVAAVIPYEDYVAIRDVLEEAQDVRDAQEALAEYDRDPESFATLDQVEQELREQGLLDG
ncbi:MAG TPA: type II toxin-antitoxin system prevent-host-death family antitoxin [Anaerolineae bacterium]|nr:type II toxin-antitoxin system prevent-host-death family antitoxin [Anaerolineae bacterium]HOG45289.1 type II toxin-antitoxin system prevent-host-death family antitoxin [Anaerolineae bacterium]HOQ98286.1 type II toxin-antitoxin system prevent-host-death family antitoxin [Anaerolineae bacterium]